MFWPTMMPNSMPATIIMNLTSRSLRPDLLHLLLGNPRIRELVHLGAGEDRPLGVAQLTLHRFETPHLVALPQRLFLFARQCHNAGIV